MRIGPIHFLISFCTALSLGLPIIVFAQFTSTNYLIDSYIIGEGGGVLGTSTNYSVEYGSGQEYEFTESDDEQAGVSSDDGGIIYGSRAKEIPTTTPAVEPSGGAASTLPEEGYVAQGPGLGGGAPEEDDRDEEEEQSLPPPTQSGEETDEQPISEPSVELGERISPLSFWSWFSAAHLKWFGLSLLGFVLLVAIYLVTRRLRGERSG